MPTVAKDLYPDGAIGLNSSPVTVFVIAPDDANELPYVTRDIRSTADCTIQVTTSTGAVVFPVQIFKGQNLMRVRKVWAANTVLGGAVLNGYP